MEHYLLVRILHSAPGVLLLLGLIAHAFMLFKAQRGGDSDGDCNGQDRTRLRGHCRCAVREPCAFEERREALADPEEEGRRSHPDDDGIGTPCRLRSVRYGVSVIIKVGIVSDPISVCIYPLFSV